jgi:2-polyprenyl-3-methyl-5-hydroxy-6-metoxy-1,4-benzoquinol methylase
MHEVGKRCPACGAIFSRPQMATDTTDIRFGVPGHFTYLGCPCCGSWVLHASPTRDELQLLYERYYNVPRSKDRWYRVLRELLSVSFVRHLQWLFLRGVSFADEQGSGRLLDYGCNEGRNLRSYASNGWTVEGYEPNRLAAAEARRQGFRIHDGDPELIASASFDVVMLSNVLEHSVDPAQLLSTARRLLSSKGELWISTPNAASWGAKLFRENWVNWHPPFHIVVFAPKALQALARSQGFEVIEMRTVSPPLWFAQSLLARRRGRIGTPTRQLRSVLPSAAFLLLAVLLSPLSPIADARGRGDAIRMRVLVHADTEAHSS